MSANPRRFPIPLTVWYACSVLWLAHVGFMGAMILFRAIKHAGIASTFQFDNVPPLRYLELNYDLVFWWAAGTGAALLCGWVYLLRRPKEFVFVPQGTGEIRRANPRAEAICAISAVLFTAIGLTACRYSSPESGSAFDVPPSGPLDWIAIACVTVTTWLLPMRVLSTSRADERLDRETGTLTVSAMRSSRVIRTGMAYLLGCAAFFIYAWREHEKFWNPELNGGYDYSRFFLLHELPQAHLVLYSTSVLFASLAALGGCLFLFLVRLTIRADSPAPLMNPAREARRVSLLLAAAWAVVLMVPWQVKILPEIRAENGWIFPAVTLLFTIAALTPVLYVSLLMMLTDFARLAVDAGERGVTETPFIPRRTEFALLNFVLFPLYPVLRAFRWINAGGVYAFLLVAGVPLAAGWLRHFLRTSEIFTLAGCRELFDSKPFPLVVFSIGALASAGVYQFRRRLTNASSLHTVMLVCGAVIVAGLTWFVNKADTLFTFDDWRSMIRSAQFPFMRVVLSLLAAYFAYLIGRRLLMRASILTSRLAAPRPEDDLPGYVKVARPVVVLATLASLGLATWPFWGWQEVSRNVFARTIEFNHRHDFELRFLHWIFDADRDGYSAVLHGADPDDFNSDVQAGGIAPPSDDNPVPISEFEIADPRKAREFPNVVVFYLEGVVPRAISAYGQRQIVGTPHMDSIARDGTLFTQARCHYPSTWDGWFAVCSGRYLRIKEMDTSRGFGNRYTRYNNLYKLLKLAGVDRWCHADTEPYFDMLVPHEMRESEATAWKPKYDTTVDSKEEKNGVWRGDKRNQRMLEFLDSLKQGEKFFMCEHMSDTHFPWKRTPIKRARELGFPDGLERYEADAILPSGRRDDKYSRYFQAITRMDAQIGQILDKLKEKGLYDNTIVIVVSDHGCQWWEHEHMYYVSHLYEPAIRIPLIIRIPGIAGGNSVDEPVMQTDILPTIMELAGLKLKNPNRDYPFTCRSLLPLMKQNATDEQRRRFWNRDVILTTHYDKLGVLSQFRHKLIFNRPTGTFRLFDLKEDPKESHNLADERPELLAEMLRKFRALMKQHGPIIGGIKKADDQEVPKATD